MKYEKRICLRTLFLRGTSDSSDLIANFRYNRRLSVYCRHQLSTLGLYVRHNNNSST